MICGTLKGKEEQETVPAGENPLNRERAGDLEVGGVFGMLVSALCTMHTYV